MPTAAQAIKKAAYLIRPMIADEKVALGAGTQAGAARISAAFTKVILGGGAGSSLVLPDLLSNEAGAGMYIVSNESGATIAVFADPGDTLNNSLNGSLTIANNGFGIFVREDRENFPFVAADWAAAAFT